MKDLCKHKEVAWGQMVMKETVTGEDTMMEEGRIGGNQEEATTIEGKMIGLVKEENGLEIIIMVRIGKIRGGKGIDKSHLCMIEETMEGGNPTVKIKKPKMKGAILGKV